MTGTRDRTGLAAHPRPLGTDWLLRASGVPLAGSASVISCGVGNGYTIARTAHDDESSSRDRSL